ncbi:MAG: hypothetical protein JSW66_12190 [Phycisphaerales bacterium]|nr:MAG: hypothetical protein JSW66_12190 [Phycisphaerales bacterium]
MKPTKLYVFSVVFFIAAGELGAQAKPAEEPALDAVQQHRRAFLEGVLFTTRQREAMMRKPPASFNTKDVLAGIESVEVVVEDLAPVVEQYGLTKQDVQARIESQLRGRRIEVLTAQSSTPAAEQAEEPNEALMRTAGIESDEGFEQGVREYLQQSEPVSSLGILDVTVTAVTDEAAGFAAYSFHVQFLQPVQLLRPDPRRSLAATWAIGKVGYVSLKDFSSVAEQAGEIIDAFIDDYLEANPNRGIRTRARETRTPPNGVVTGIVRSQDSSTAVVGTQVVREGETIDGVTIVRIHDDRVEFEKAGRRWTQEINEPPSEQWQ